MSVEVDPLADEESGVTLRTVWRSIVLSRLVYVYCMPVWGNHAWSRCPFSDGTRVGKGECVVKEQKKNLGSLWTIVLVEPKMIVKYGKRFPAWYFNLLDACFFTDLICFSFSFFCHQYLLWRHRDFDHFCFYFLSTFSPRLVFGQIKFRIWRWTWFQANWKPLIERRSAGGQ